MSSGNTVQLNAMFKILVIGFSMIWLLAERIANRNRIVTFLLAALIYFAFLGVNLLSVGFSKDMIGVTYLTAISISAIVFAITIALLISPKSFSVARFIIYIGAALFIFLLTISSAIMFTFYSSSTIPIDRRIAEVLNFTFLSTLIFYVGLMPFLALLFGNPFWLKRFKALSGIQTNIDLQHYDTKGWQ